MEISANSTKTSTGTEAKNNKQSVPVSSPVEGAAKPNPESVDDEELDLPYIDNRTITIALAKRYSLYRKANDKVLPKKVNYIGSSYQSSLTISSDKTFVETYFPAVLGLSPNHDNFITRVKQHLNNIQVIVDETDKQFNISFIYNTKRDYLRFARKEEAIEAAYAAVDRNNFKKLREALNQKIDALVNLEFEKSKYGKPIKFEDYLLYIHCLLYKDVAKDLAFINTDNNIRFYFKDDRKEAERAKKYRIEINKAKVNFVKCCENDNLFNAVYIQYCTANNIPVSSGLSKDRMTQEIELDRFSNDDPIKFNKICANKDVELIGKIELLIARNELTRMEHNQNIYSLDGEFIGANITEAVMWFKNPDNSSVVTAYMNKLVNA